LVSSRDDPWAVTAPSVAYEGDYRDSTVIAGYYQVDIRIRNVGDASHRYIVRTSDRRGDAVIDRDGLRAGCDVAAGVGSLVSSCDDPRTVPAPHVAHEGYNWCCAVIRSCYQCNIRGGNLCDTGNGNIDRTSDRRGDAIVVSNRLRASGGIASGVGGMVSSRDDSRTVTIPYIAYEGHDRCSAVIAGYYQVDIRSRNVGNASNRNIVRPGD